MSFNIRLAKAVDIPSILDLINESYGSNYCFPQIYQQSWQNARIQDRDWFILIAEKGGEVCAVSYTRFDIMTKKDLCAELWLSIVSKKYRNLGLLNELTNQRLDLLRRKKLFCYSLNTVVYDYSQKAQEKSSFLPVGLLPMRDMYDIRQSYVMHATILNGGQSIPARIIPSIYPLAKQTYLNFGLPFEATYICSSKNNINLNHQVLLMYESHKKIGYIKYIFHNSDRRIISRFDIRDKICVDNLNNFRFMVATLDGLPVGYLVYLYEECNQLVELLDIAANDGTLLFSILYEFNKIISLDMKIVYIETNASATDNEIQNILYFLDYKPVAYCPKMGVTKNGLRIDVVKMVKLKIKVNIANIETSSKGKKICEIVLKNFTNSDTSINESTDKQIFKAPFGN